MVIDADYEDAELAPVTFMPMRRHFAYMRAVLKLGLEATQSALAKEAGLTQPQVSKMLGNPAFVRWRNEELMRIISVEIPTSAAFAIDTWLRAVKQRAQEWRDTNGKSGRPPTDKEMGRLLQLADRFNLSLYIPEGEKHVHLNLVNIVVDKDSALDEDKMLVRG